VLGERIHQKLVAGGIARREAAALARDIDAEAGGASVGRARRDMTDQPAKRLERLSREVRMLAGEMEQARKRVGIEPEDLKSVVATGAGSRQRAARASAANFTLAYVMSTATGEILTIGHSTHPWERFVALLRNVNVTAVADVRTSPYSRHCPQFNHDTLRAELPAAGIAYVFLGKELGGRARERSFYCEGTADYEKMAQAPEFKKGLDRVIEGAKKYRIALMCAERDPLDCHRCLLVGRALAQRGVRVNHILDDGNVVSHGEIEDALLRLSGRDTTDLFASQPERLAVAYRVRARKVVYVEPQS